MSELVPFFKISGMKSVLSATKKALAIRTNLSLLPTKIAPDVADTVLGHLKESVPVGSGSGDHARDALISAVVGSTVTFQGPEYLKYVIEGTEPHEIPSGGADAGIILHFFIGGDELFRKAVYHPGTAPNDFRKEAWEQSREEVVGMLFRAV